MMNCVILAISFSQFLFGIDRINLLGTPEKGELAAFWPAFIIALLMAAVLGLLIHVLVFRPLRGAPLLAKVVATVGVLYCCNLSFCFGSAPPMKR